MVGKTVATMQATAITATHLEDAVEKARDTATTMTIKNVGGVTLARRPALSSRRFGRQLDTTDRKRPKVYNQQHKQRRLQD